MNNVVSFVLQQNIPKGSELEVAMVREYACLQVCSSETKAPVDLSATALVSAQGGVPLPLAVPMFLPAQCAIACSYDYGNKQMWVLNQEATCMLKALFSYV